MVARVRESKAQKAGSFSAGGQGRIQGEPPKKKGSSTDLVGAEGRARARSPDVLVKAVC
jgi:hypothetical protein